ncbi:MAG: prepilin-type N-terminal cleavage/methylation domain-containing protein [Verrucomicrobiales bacterium]|nr:prepilin-type N-terminal cleavage/methylation domain-containing protein [Verrucomicrobiales bacterium]
MKHSSFKRQLNKGLTMIEILVVIAILGILIGILVPSLGKAKEVAEAVKNTYNLKQIAVATINWAADNGSKLPSPQYPGGMEAPKGIPEEDFFPPYYNVGETGLWLDGVIFAEMYLKEANVRENEEEDPSGATDVEETTGGYTFDENGSHLKGTLFENTMSVKKDPGEEDWHKHSYAMNASLQYDRIYDSVNTSDPYLTEKTLSNLVFAPNAMLYIDCIETNVIRFEERESVIETSEERWDGGKLIAAFIDGHAERLSQDDVPSEDPSSDLKSSRFWRGVNPD